MNLAAEAAAFLQSRRKAVERAPAGFRIERRSIPAKSPSVRLIASAPPFKPPAPALRPLAADLARILSDPRGFPWGVM